MNRTTRINEIVAAVDGYSEEVRSFGLEQTAFLLRVAKLDLQLHLHEITDNELKEVCAAVSRGIGSRQASVEPQQGSGGRNAIFARRSARAMRNSNPKPIVPH